MKIKEYGINYLEFDNGDKIECKNIKGESVVDFNKIMITDICILSDLFNGEKHCDFISLLNIKEVENRLLNNVGFVYKSNIDKLEWIGEEAIYFTNTNYCESNKVILDMNYIDEEHYQGLLSYFHHIKIKGLTLFSKQYRFFVPLKVKKYDENGEAEISILYNGKEILDGDENYHLKYYNKDLIINNQEKE